MTTPLAMRRYLTDFDSGRIGHVLTDVLVIGGGVAGMRAAIEAARHGDVILLTKAGLDDSCTAWAQGGIAASLASNDSTQKHFDDTVRVGCNLNDEQAVRRLVDEGPECIGELTQWGMQLDHDGDELAFGREGGHSVSRVVHANGDQTGKELARTLAYKLHLMDNIRVFHGCFLVDLITCDDVCAGAVTFQKRHGHQLIWAKQTILASGGCGRIWRETTNPPVATGDGIAAAFRAGAVLQDMEMVQFHPTTLYIAGATRALISEAVRGEGAYLVDRAGERFVQAFHPDGELAPRDIVSRAIHKHLTDTRSNCVYLDGRHVAGFVNRFPYIAKLCADFEIDVTRDLIPVRPSAHYMIGGVKAQLDGRTSLEGLLCCGEVSCTGVHGANRMASNSLLEGLVFGKAAGETAGRTGSGVKGSAPTGDAVNQNPASTRTALDLPDIRNSLRSVMWRNVGIVRRADRLGDTCDILDFWAHYTLDKVFDDTDGWEIQNTLTVARLIVMSALERGQSLGVHYREDESKNSDDSSYHLTLRLAAKGAVLERDLHHKGTKT